MAASQTLNPLRRPLRPASTAILLAVLLGADPGSAPAQSRDWSGEDRVVIGDYSHILAVATTLDRVFAVTRTAILSYEPQSRRWAPPEIPREPELLADVIAALADPLDNSLWLIRRNGWLRFDPGIRFWEQGFVPGVVSDAALDQNNPAGGLFLRTSTGWYQAGRGGVALPGSAPAKPIRPANPDVAIRENPAIQANSAGLMLASRLRPIRYTSAARATGFAGRGWFLGTNGVGLVYFPDGSGFPQPLIFGLPADAAGAVFAGPDGAWVATDRTGGADPALTFVSRELTEFSWLQGPRATGLPFSLSRRILGQGSALYLATDAGIIRITPKNQDVERFDEGRGLPDRRVLDLAQRRGRIAVGTQHGLAAGTDSAGFQPIAPGFTDAANAVALGEDTVWVGTRLGLFVALPGESDLLQPPALRESLTLQSVILDLTWRADTLVALTPERLLWRDPATGCFTIGPLLGNRLGRLHTVGNSPTGLFVAGEGGVGFTRLNTPLIRSLTTPGDLPGRVTDLAVDDQFLWIATQRGLVRFRLDAVSQ